MAIELVDILNDDKIWSEWKCAISDQNQDFEFTIRGDEFIVYRNTDNGEHAVYYKLWNGGELVCRIQNFENMMCMTWGNVPSDFSGKLLELFRTDAIEHGFPAKHPPIPKRPLTWREVRDYLNGIMSDEVLDMYAAVWLYNDVEYPDGQNRIVGLDPYNNDLPAGKDNGLSFNIEEV